MPPPFDVQTTINFESAGTPPPDTVIVYQPATVAGVNGFASGTIHAGKAVIRLTDNTYAQATSSNIQTHQISGLAITSALDGEPITIVTIGPVAATIAALGTGFSCAVGINSSADPVRVTDASCISKREYIGYCDASGKVTLEHRISDEYNAKDYGFVADWNGTTGTDNLAALEAALAAAARDGKYHNQGCVLHIQGYGYVSNTLHVMQEVHIKGDGKNSPWLNAGYVWAPGTMLVFPGLCTGIRLHGAVDFNNNPQDYNYITDGYWVNPNSYPDPYWTANESRVSNLTLYCKDHNDVFGHGIHSTVRCHIDDVHIEQFGGDGVRIDADHTANGGNASGAKISGCLIGVCGGHGVHLTGGDSNVITVERVDVEACLGYGFYDSFTLGNTFIGCEGAGNHSPHTEPHGNVGPAIDYKVEGFTTAATLIGCYAELSLNEISAASIVIGGNLTMMMAPTATAMVLNGSSANNAPFFHYNRSAPVTVTATLGGQGSDMTALGFATPDASEGYDHNELNYNNTLKWWSLINCGNAGRHYFDLPGSQSGARFAAPLFQNGIQFGYYNEPIIQNYRSAVPTTGVWVRGDIVWNSLPTETSDGLSKYVIHGWSCVASGDFAGTPPTFVELRTPTGAVTTLGTYNKKNFETIQKNVGAGTSNIAIVDVANKIGGFVTMTAVGNSTANDGSVMKLTATQAFKREDGGTVSIQLVGSVIVSESLDLDGAFPAPVFVTVGDGQSLASNNQVGIGVTVAAHPTKNVTWTVTTELHGSGR